MSSVSAQGKKKGSFSSYGREPVSNQITALLDSARNLSESAPMRAIDKINKAIELSIGENDKANEGLSYLVLGNIQQGLGQDELASDNYKKCIAALTPKGNSKTGKLRSDNTSEKTLFSAWMQLAASQLRLNTPSMALSSILRCFEDRFEDINETEQLRAKRVQATILSRLRRNEEALEILLITLDQEKKRRDTEGEAYTLLALGTFYEQMKNETRALEYYQQAKEVAEKSKNKEMLVNANNKLAGIYRQQKNVDKEVEARSNNIALSNSINKIKEAEQQNKEIGNAYLNTQQMDKALPFFEKSLSGKDGKSIIPEELFGKSNDLESMANTYKLLAEEYLKMGATDRALLYLGNFVKIQDSIKAIRKRELDDALKISNELGKNQQRVDLLEKERQLSERSIKVLKQDKDLKEEQLSIRNIIIGSLCLLLIFLALSVLYILKSSREKRRANQLLAIKSLRGQMNPHFIFNALNSVNHYISQNDERAANKYLSDFSRLMRSVMETSKFDLILLTEELEILKLYLQLEHARFKDSFDYTFVVDDQIDPSEFELPPMIIQPFIENAVWHGLRYTEGKGHLDIRISQNDQGLMVSIVDNGIGRKKSLEIKTRNQKLQNSTGMQNIENRIRIMNELFKTTIKATVSDAFEDQENTGTRVNLFIPKKINKHA